MFGNPACGINQIVFFSTFIRPRPFLILVNAHQTGLLLTVLVLVFLFISAHRLFRQRNFHDFAIVVYHAPGQLHIPQPVISPIQVSLPVVINKNGRVDVAYVMVDKGALQRIPPRPARRLPHQHTDTPQLDRGIHVPFPVTRNHMGCPRPVVTGPTEISQRRHRAAVGPIHHVRGCVQLPNGFLVAFPLLVVHTGIKIEGIPINAGCRVGRVTCLYDRILRPGLSGSQHAGDSPCKKILFHSLWFLNI